MLIFAPEFITNKYYCTMAHKLHNHPKKEYELQLAGVLGFYEYIVNEEFAHLFHRVKEIPNYTGHIAVPMCEYFEHTEPKGNLGDIVRTGTKVKITSCDLHPEYIGKSGTIAMWFAPTEYDKDVLYNIESDGEILDGVASRYDFEIIEDTYFTLC